MTRSLNGAGILAWNLFAWVLWGAAVVEALRTPACRFVHGWWTKLSRLVAVSVLSVAIAGLFLPFGAAAILAGLRRSATHTRQVEFMSQRERPPSRMNRAQHD